MEYEIFYVGMDGLDHMESFEGTNADLQKLITFLEERGAHQIAICCQGIQVI